MCGTAWAQVTVSSVQITGINISLANVPGVSLPQVWANDHECDPPGGVFDVVKHIPGDYTIANAQQANVDWQAAADQSWHIIVAHGSVLGPITFLAKAVGGGLPTKCIVWDSDTPLPTGVTVCTHGIQDNVPTSTDPGIRNPDCNGTGMSYQLRQTLTSISAGPFTLANGTATNTSAYNDVASMFTIQCTTANCAAVTAGSPDVNGNGPNHFALYNAELRVGSSQTCCFPVDIENNGSTVQSIPSHYHLDRVWNHSDATDAGAGTQALTDNFRLNCGTNCSLSNSASSKSIRPGSEGHGIYYQDTGGLKVVHNFIEGMSIGAFDGGISNSVPGGVSGRDLEYRRNRFTYPLPWLGHGSGAGSVCGAGTSCVRKNCFEHKGINRIVFDGNICENVDNSGAQNGTLTDFNNRACQNPCDNSVQTIQNVTISNTIYRHGCGGIVFDPGSSSFNGSSPDTPGRNFFISNTLLYDISINNFGCNDSNNGSLYLGGSSYAFAVTSTVRTGGITTITLTSAVGVSQTGLVSGDPIKVSSCTDTSFNVGPYPFVTALTVNGLVVTYNNPGPDATSTGCVFNNGAGWPNNFAVDHVTAVGDWAIYMGNNLTAPGATFPRNQRYTNSIFTGTRGFGSPGGTEGTAFKNTFLDFTTLLVHHNVFSQRVAPVWQANTAYKLGQVVQPVGGNPSRFYSVVTSGTSGAVQPTFTSGAFACISDGTVVWQNNGFSTSTFGGLPDYTEYQAFNTPIRPPTTLFFPQTDFTYGSTADATSIGFQGALNAPASGTNTCVGGTQVPGINVAGDLNDWHDYKLHSSSVFVNRATDGKDLGAIISDIEAAETRTQYVCQTPCGSGPTPD